MYAINTMEPTSSIILFVFLPWTLHAVLGNPIGGASIAAPVKTPSLQTIVTTATVEGSTYTLTYLPSTVTATTLLAEGTSSVSVPAGAIVGALAGAAAIAALPLAIPKVVPEEDLKGDGPEETGCQKDIAHVCRQDCTADWFVSSKKAVTTSSCAKAACEETAGCNIADSTQTSLHSITAPDFSTVTSLTASQAPPTSAPPLNYAVIQAYLGQQYQRLHLDDDGGKQKTAAACEQNPAKAVLEIKGLKV